jgi:hypothetical protein
MTLTTHHGQRTIHDFVEMFRARKLNLEPAFQRQSVWSLGDRRLLIQSLLEGIPLPSIYLYRQVGAGGVPKYDVIDGKQRLESILWFLGKGPLAGEDELWVRTTFDNDQPIDWWSWREFGKRAKNDFLTTKVATIEVEGDLGDIIDLFVRINATGKRLTGQEKRNARFYASPVLKVAQRLADEHREFLIRNKVLSAGQVQRMKHVELVAELLLSINAGQPLNKKTKIDEIIRGASLDAGDLRDAASSLNRALRYVQAILPDLRTTRLSNSVDFYTLTLLLHRLKEDGWAISAHNSQRNAFAGALLRDFARGVDEVQEQIRLGRGIGAGREPYREYLLTVRSDTDSFKQRVARERLLREVLEGAFDELDSRRLFNATQRRIIWHSSASKTCTFCDRPIVRWEEMAADHVEPHSGGGKTALSNAAIAHRRCNAEAGAKRPKRSRGEASRLTN